MTITSLSSALAAMEVNSSRRATSTDQVSSSAAVQSDSPQVSKLGSYMQQLESLQSSDPTKFKEMTASIATKLEDAAKTAAESGDTQQASALNDMAAKFKTSSETGEMPQLGRGHGGPPPGGPPPSSDSGSTSSTSSSSTSSSSTDTLDAELAKLLAQYTQSSGTDPMSTLSGILAGAFQSTSAA